MAEAAAEIHQLKSANEALSKQLKASNDEVKVLQVLNQRGDAELGRLHQAVSASKDAMVRSSSLILLSALHLGTHYPHSTTGNPKRAGREGCLH
jgi:hypothetical protein